MFFNKKKSDEAIALGTSDLRAVETRDTFKLFSVMKLFSELSDAFRVWVSPSAPLTV